jgi:hypothetical protein
VIEGGDGAAGPRAWGRNYRVQNVFDRVIAWLREHGVTAKKGSLNGSTKRTSRKRLSPALLVMLIALAAGLRKGEIDTLCWHQVDFNRGLIRVEHTDTASLK